MSKICMMIVMICSFITLNAQSNNTDLMYKFNDSGSNFAQITFLNQTWLRYNESVDGTTVNGEEKENTFDIGLRRTRMQMLFKPFDDVFLYFQLI